MSAYDEPRGHAADAFVSKPFDPIEMVQLVEVLSFEHRVFNSLDT